MAELDDAMGELPDNDGQLARPWQEMVARRVHNCFSVKTLLLNLEEQAEEYGYSVCSGFPLSEKALLGLSITLGAVCAPPVHGAQAVHSLLGAGERNLAPFFEELHTDSSTWRIPNAYTFLLCLAADTEGGGESVLLPCGDLEHDDTACALRDTPVPWRVEGNRDIMWAPISDSHGNWRWYPDAIALQDLVTPTRDAISALRVLIAERAVHAPTMLLRPGDLLLINNRRCLHARGPILSGEQTGRHLLRTKVWS